MNAAARSLESGAIVRRVAILIEYPTVNGGENSILAMLKYLLDVGSAKSGFEFCVLGPSAGTMAERIGELGLPVVDLNLFDSEGARLPREQAIPQLQEAIEKSGADLIHGNSLAMGRLLGAAARQDSRLVTTSHLRDIMKLSRAAISDLNANRRLVAVSDATLRFHEGQWLDSSIGVVIHNGIDAGDFVANDSSRTRIRQELGIPEDAVVLLTVGQIGLRKGLDTLADVGQRLARERSEIHWLLAGERFSQKFESVEYEANVLKKFSSCEPALRLHRLGYRRDIPELMRASDMLVHAARQEPLGRVLLEAAASGLAIVATDVGGTAEILAHRESALLVPADSPTATTDAISILIDDVAFRNQLASAARCRIRSDFSIETSAVALANIWRSVLSKTTADQITAADVSTVDRT
ncbi:MAG: glycosyltransferase family 4 protein [Rhodopirellula sp.]|nr:glycosyltransferase family 4 protein [Rhodopirellula sp.]